MENNEDYFSDRHLISARYNFKLHESKLRNTDKLSRQMMAVCGFLIKRYNIETTTTTLQLVRVANDFICNKWTLQITFINEK